MKRVVKDIIIISVFSVFNIVLCFSQDDVKAKIISNVVDNLIDIKAVAQNNEPVFKEDYSYLLFALKKGTDGNYSRSNQSDKFSLKANEKKELAILKINIQKDEEYKVYLFIRKDKQLISKDSIVIYAAEKEADRVIEETGFEIKGIVVESVITKIGKDFFDYFYQAYSTSGTQHPFIINIKEKPYFGRSSIISIEIEDNKIVEFYSKPDEDFLRSQVRSTLQRIYQYSIQRKLLFKKRI